MITEGVLTVLHGLAMTLATFLHDAVPAAPSFMTDMTAAVGVAFNLVPGPVRYFVPIGPSVAAALTVIALIGTMGAVRFARRVLSLLTGGGGSA